MKSFLIIGLIAAASSCVSAASYNEAIAEISATFPGLDVGTPQVLKVVYDNGAFMDLGKNVTPTETKNQPSIDWNANADTYYTILIVDPDGPSQEDPYLRDIVTFLEVNIPGKDISKGDPIVKYVSAGPPKNMGDNRYFCMAFKQKGKQEFDETRANETQIDGRLNFDTVGFVNKYQMILDAFNFISSYYDEQTIVLYQQLKCCEDLY